MTIAQLTQKMISYSEGNLHDISHFLKVWGFAKTIGELEGLESETHKDVQGDDYQILLEADYLVNAEESGYSLENIQNAVSRIFKTKSGKQMVKSIYGGISMEEK